MAIEYDIEGLRSEIMDTLETEAVRNPVALGDISRAYSGNISTLLELAKELGVDAEDYELE